MFVLHFIWNASLNHNCESCVMPVGTSDNFCNGSSKHVLMMAECSLHIAIGQS